MDTAPLRRFFSQTLAVALLAALAAGCAEGPTGSVTVEGALAGTNAQSTPMSPTTLRLTHRVGAPGRRVDEATDARIEDLQSMTLVVTTVTGGPFRDEFVLATVIEETPPTEGDDTERRFHGDDPDWTRRRLGQLALVRLPVSGGEVGQTASRTFASGPRRRAGTAWLMRLEDGDQIIPWTLDDGDARCRAVPLSSSLVAPPLGQTRDCFDLRTLAGMVLAHVAKAVTEGLDDGPLPALVTPTAHRLYIVPSLSQASGGEALGFGLIYAADLRIGERGGQPDATVYVPVGVHFRPALSADASPSDLEAVFEPLGPTPRSPIGAGRVTLAYRDRTAPGGLAQDIRSIVVESLERAVIPSLVVDGKELSAEQAVGRLIDAVAPPRTPGTPYPSSVDAVALPVDRSSTEAATPTLVLSLPRVSTTISTDRTEGAGGLSHSARMRGMARGDGTVVVTSPLDPPGRIRRVTTLSPMQTGHPYELRIMRYTNGR